MAEMKPKIVVIGCGVIGLTSGVRLLEAGFDVQIVARDLPPNTHSNAAAAIWYPYKAFPIDRVLAWGHVSIRDFYELTAVTASGISIISLHEVFREKVEDPWWLTAVLDFRRMSEHELPAGYADGYIVEVPLIETPIYVKHLFDRFQESGGRIEQRELHSFDELRSATSLVINCTGVGARTLAEDEEVYPIRGQIVKVHAPDVTTCILDQGVPTYVAPRADGVILGGTAQNDNWNMEADTGTAEAILDRCKTLLPELRDAEVIEHIVGLRPGRASVRLELEQLDDELTLIHNYGHGGAGFTLSWGCAQEVVQLAREYFSDL